MLSSFLIKIIIFFLPPEPVPVDYEMHPPKIHLTRVQKWLLTIKYIIWVIINIIVKLFILYLIFGLAWLLLYAVAGHFKPYFLEY